MSRRTSAVRLLVVGSWLACGGASYGQSLLPFSTVNSTVNPTYGLGSAPQAAAERMKQPIGQMNPTSYSLPTVATTIPTQPMSAVPSRARSVIGFYGGQSAAQTLQSMPRRPSLGATSVAPVRPPRPARKPFSTVTRDATVSPYLNLYLEEQGDAAPNYFAFVRPQLQQREQNRQQQAELQRLQRKVQGITTASAARSSATAPATGHRTRFGDTGQFYSGFAR